MRRKIHTEYIKEVSEINLNIEVLGNYINAKTKILHKCKIDGYEWYAAPSNILQGRGCPKCGKIIKAERKRKNHYWYISKVYEINPNIEVIEEYRGYHEKILHKCKIDGYEWYVAPSVILSGSGCPECASLIRLQKRRKTHDIYVEEVAKINPSIEVIETYINTHTKILHRCKACGHEWYVEPSHILIGNGCPVCAKISMAIKERKSHEEYVNEVFIINPNIEVVEEYINAKTPILHRCRIDGYEWYAIPSNILNGRGCPKCRFSYGEYNIDKYLTKHNIVHIFQHRFSDCKNKRTLPFDFYLPDYNVCIEFDGKQHFEAVDIFGGIDSLQATQRNDNIKTKYCANNNIILLRIKYDQNIEEILNNFFNKEMIN